MTNIGVETETIEFKKSTGELKEGIISLAAMLNKNGHGTLYFGVNDSGAAVGQQVGNRTLREISQAIANNIKPQVIPTIEHSLIDELNVIKIEAIGYEKPYSAYGKYYMRSSDEDRELTPAALRKLMQNQSMNDIITVIESPVQELSFQKLKIAFVTAGLTVEQDTFEKNTGLLDKDGRYNYMSYLLADKNDISIKAVTFAGKDKTKMLKRNEYGGTCLITAMDRVLDYMESINETKVEIGSHRRKEEKLFDFLSFKEAWENACLHTRWDKGTPPAVYIFSDRIEIISTGGLPYDLDREEFFKGISKPVNLKLQKIFGQLGYVEQTGHGVPLIINNYGRQAFDIMENFLNVTIPFNFKSKRNSADYASYTADSDKLSEADLKVVETMRQNAGVTIAQMSRDLGFSSSYIKQIISKLKGCHMIERLGGRKSGRWAVNL